MRVVDTSIHQANRLKAPDAGSAEESRQRRAVRDRTTFPNARSPLGCPQPDLNWRSSRRLNSAPFLFIVFVRHRGETFLGWGRLQYGNRSSGFNHSFQPQVSGFK